MGRRILQIRGSTSRTCYLGTGHDLHDGTNQRDMALTRNCTGGDVMMGMRSEARWRQADHRACLTAYTNCVKLQLENIEPHSCSG